MYSAVGHLQQRQAEKDYSVLGQDGQHDWTLQSLIKLTTYFILDILLIKTLEFMRKLFGFTALLAALFLMAACGDSNTPSAVAENAVKAMQNEDYEKFAEYVYLNSNDSKHPEESKKMIAGLMQTKAGAAFAEKKGIKDFKVLSEEIDEKGEKAVVNMEIKYGDGSSEKDDMKLRKDKEGNWKVELGK